MSWIRNRRPKLRHAGGRASAYWLHGAPGVQGRGLVLGEPDGAGYTRRNADMKKEPRFGGCTLPPVVGPSRQRKWQKDRRAIGLCVICGKPSTDKDQCDDCAAKAFVKRGGVGSTRRHPAKSAWSAVDWSKRNREIAEAFGVVESAVRYQRAIRKANPSVHRMAHGQEKESGI